MEFASSLTETFLIMAVFAAFVASGYILRKKNLFGDSALSSLSDLLLYVCQPFIIIRAFAVKPVAVSSRIGTNMLWVALLSLVSILFAFGLSKLVFSAFKDEKNKNVYSFASIFSNCCFIGIPLVDIMTGGNGEALLYIGVYNVVSDIAVHTLGMYMMTGSKKEINLKRVVLNPAIIGSYIGLLLFFIPQINIFAMEEFAVLNNVPVYFGYAAAVLGVMMIGARASDIPVKSLLSDSKSYVAAVLKSVVVPAVMFAVVFLTDEFVYSFIDGYVWLCVLIASAISPAFSCVAYADKFCSDKDCAVKSVAVGTVVCAIVLPIMIALLSIAYI